MTSVWGGVAVVALAVVVWITGPLAGAPWSSPLAGSRREAGGTTAALPPEPVQSFEPEGIDHIPLGRTATYRTDPPASGPHYDLVAQPGLYTDRAPSPGFLVHNLEHGHVVIYYSRSRLTGPARRYLEALTRRYQGAWDAVLAVPRDDDRYELILTAWRHIQRLPAFDQSAVDAFLDQFRGRGPERPVR